ncbi:MAG: metallophosphoesterase family protein [Bacillota bacterium]
MAFTWRAGLKRLGLVFFCLLGAVVAVNGFARVETSGAGLTFAARVRLLAPAETRISLPPLGFLAARTHRVPVRVELELRGLAPSFLQGLGEQKEPRERLVAATVAQAREAAYRVVFFALFLAGAGGLAAMALVHAFSFRALGGGFLLGVVFAGGLLGLGFLQYDREAFAQPRYEGLLESAPWVMSILDDSLAGLERLGEGLAVMARNLPRLSHGGGLGTPMGEAGEDLRVLHVSDVHNNPAAYKLITALAEGFAVDLVIDTGDLTDYGTPLEGELATAIARLKVPYVFVPGNHDSPEVISRLRRLKNVVILEGRPVKVKGLCLLGRPDPASVAWTNDVPAVAALARAGEELRAAWEAAAVKPDLVTAHNFEILRPLLGKARVLLHGHDHRASLQELAGSLVVDAGTTGAAGYRGLASEKAVPYTLNLQYWRKEAGGRFRLVAVDAITFDDFGGRLQVIRKVFTEEPARTAARH